MQVADKIHAHIVMFKSMIMMVLGNDNEKSDNKRIISIIRIETINIIPITAREISKKSTTKKQNARIKTRRKADRKVKKKKT